MQNENRSGAVVPNAPFHNYHLCIILAFALNDVNLVAVSEQVGDPEVAHLADAQAGRVRRLQ